VLENHHWRSLVCFLKCSHICDHFTTEAWLVAVSASLVFFYLVLF